MTIFFSWVTRMKLPNVTSRILETFMKWHELQRFVTLLYRSVRVLQYMYKAAGKDAALDLRFTLLVLGDLVSAESTVFSWVQEKAYPQELQLLKSGKTSTLR